MGSFFDSIKFITVLLALITVYSTADSQIVINEVSASNDGLPYDDSMDSPDWIELYNSGSESVNLQNYHISDQRDISKAWRLPDVIIDPNEFLIIFASGKNEYLTDKIIIEASGHGITPLETKDEFRFDYIQYQGDFDISMRVHAFMNAPLYATVGLMLRTNLTNDSKMIGMFCRRKERRYFSSYFRDNIGTLLKEKHTKIKPDFPDCRIQVKRTGDSVYTNIIDETGFLLESIAYYFPIQYSFYVGIAVSSGDKTIISRSVISDIKFNDNIFTIDDMNSIEFGNNIGSKSYNSYELHSNFKLDKDSDAVYLFRPDGSISDSMIFNDLRANVSIGRLPDGSDKIVFFEQPSPNDTNKVGKQFICKKPEFSTNGGFFDSSQELILTASEPNSKIYYTIDGSTPSSTSILYLSPILIDKTTVIRAISTNEFGINSLDETHTFFINETEILPVFSLSSSPHLLFSKDSGLMHNDNLWPSRQIPMHFELWENGVNTYSRTVEARLHGQVTRTYPQKSLRFYARKIYDTPEFNFDFFGENSLNKYEHILLRNGGSDWNEARIRDAFCNVLAQNFENLIHTNYRPITAYINGKYWGIYNLRERLNEHFLAEKYQVSEESINLMEQFDYLINGSSRTYFAIFDTLNKLNMIEDSSVVILSQMIDLANIVDYTIFNSFLGNFDWTFNNIKFFSSSELDSKWRWVLYDMDYTTGLWGTGTYNNVLERALDRDTSDFAVIMTSLLQNEKFRIQFINRYADLLNSKLRPEITVPVIDSLADEFEPEVDRHRELWPESMIKWEERIIKIQNFLKEKADYERKYIAKQFNLEGDYRIIINTNIPNSASFEINSIEFDSLPWTGHYFDNVPIRLKVKARYGKKFISWSDPNFGNSEEIIINANDDLELTAIFEDEGNERKIVINEIMYKAADQRDTKDWIELLNNSEYTVDLSSWILSDDNTDHKFIIPQETFLEPNDLIVICRDIDEFRKFFPNLLPSANIIGDFDFGFGTADAVNLFDQNYELIDRVEYTSEFPWYPEANGNGPSLELISPDLDNSIASNWKVSLNYGGSPCEFNLVESVKSDKEQKILIYPNPAINYINIRFEDIHRFKSIEIIDLYGRRIERMTIDGLNFRIDLTDYNQGIYYLKAIGSQTGLFPFVIVK